MVHLAGILPRVARRSSEPRPKGVAWYRLARILSRAGLQAGMLAGILPRLTQLEFHPPRKGEIDVWGHRGP